MTKEELEKASEAMKALGIVAIAAVILVICMAVAYPFVIIAALNTLFPMLSIPYNFLTWIATAFLHFCTFGYLHILNWFKN